MKSVGYIGHQADIRMNIRADSQAELLEAGLIGMANLLKDGFCLENQPRTVRQTIRIQSNDPTALLIDFLSEVLMISHIHKAVFCELRIEHFTETEFIGQVMGDGVSEFDEDIKALTYQEANVHLNAQRKWETVVVFDL